MINKLLVLIALIFINCANVLAPTTPPINIAAMNRFPSELQKGSIWKYSSSASGSMLFGNSHFEGVAQVTITNVDSMLDTLEVIFNIRDSNALIFTSPDSVGASTISFGYDTILFYNGTVVRSVSKSRLNLGYVYSTLDSATTRTLSILISGLTIPEKGYWVDNSSLITGYNYSIGIGTTYYTQGDAHGLAGFDYTLIEYNGNRVETISTQ